MLAWALNYFGKKKLIRSWDGHKSLGPQLSSVTSSFDKPSERGPIELVECSLKLKNFFFPSTSVANFWENGNVFALTPLFLLFLFFCAVSAKGCGSWQERTQKGQRHERVEAGIGHRRPQDSHRGALPTTGHQSRDGKFSLFCLSVRPSVCVSHFPYLSMTSSSPQRFFLGTRWQMAHTHTISFVFPFATTTTTPSQPHSTSLFLPSPSP